jgi:hypothetical protein
VKIRGAITKLRDQIKALELRSAILQRTLTQTWQEEKDTAISSDPAMSKLCDLDAIVGGEKEALGHSKRSRHECV